MPISCHSRDCKALLVTSLTHVGPKWRYSKCPDLSLPLPLQVTKNKKWRDVSSALNIGPSSSAGFTLKKNYGKHLFPFECRFDRGNIDPAPLLAFLDQPSKKESKKAAAERAAAVAGDVGVHLLY